MLRTRILESFERLRHPQVTPGHGLVTGPPFTLHQGVSRRSRPVTVWSRLFLLRSQQASEARQPFTELSIELRKLHLSSKSR